MRTWDALALYRMQDRGLFSMEWPADPGMYPEQRLWTAVILYALTEYKEQLIHMRKLWDAEHKPVSQFLLTSLQKLRYEIRHPWFGRICELAERNQADVVNRIRALDMQYGLAEIEFTHEETRITRHQTDKAKKRLQYA